ncbi:uncharacterized protein LOC119428766 [Nematolebias whitei]|uniref:uncharacterized protein LOC119428766 n=1 Tax=Nematolebias whitei TaxID=451745 RepID=UPI00189A031A|nr:uncharacterized protein LOC119428766 [Nematolebias whitei]
MTGGIMRPHSCWTVLNFSVLAALFLTSKADSEICTTVVVLRRNTVYEVLPGEEVRIKCPVEFCNLSPPTVSWIKLEENYVKVNVSSNNHIKTEWKTLKQQYGESYLIIQKVLRSDSGTYRCQVEGSMSHNIYIKVEDHVQNTTDSSKAKTNGSNTDKSDSKALTMMYVYSAAGTGSFIVMVIIISVISIRGCKRKPKTETQTENQYIEIPMADRPHASSLQPSPRGSPDLMPSRRSSERKTPRTPSEQTSGNNEHLYDQRKQNRDRLRNAAPSEERGSVVYAALNHEIPRTGPQPQRMVEETEYAAIHLV